MQFVYKPEGADPKSWAFAPGKLMSPEAEAIERQTGMTLVQWQSAVLDGSMLATRAFLYVMLKRKEPTLKWESVQFCMDEIDFETDATESAAIAEALGKKAIESGLSEDEQAALDEALARLAAGEPASDPKASESSSVSATQASSPTS